MGLHVGKRAPKEFLGPLDGECLDFIDELTTAIVPTARVALSAFVRENRSLCRQHRVGNNILGCYQSNLLLLTP